jgi:hypothetical protein
MKNFLVERNAIKCTFCHNYGLPSFYRTGMIFLTVLFRYLPYNINALEEKKSKRNRRVRTQTHTHIITQSHNHTEIFLGV